MAHGIWFLGHSGLIICALRGPSPLVQVSAGEWGHILPQLEVHFFEMMFTIAIMVYLRFAYSEWQFLPFRVESESASPMNNPETPRTSYSRFVRPTNLEPLGNQPSATIHNN